MKIFHLQTNICIYNGLASKKRLATKTSDDIFRVIGLYEENPPVTGNYRYVLVMSRES